MNVLLEHDITLPINYHEYKIVIVCLWGFEEPIKILTSNNFKYNILSNENTKVLQGINISEVATFDFDYTFFWIYKNPQLQDEVKEQASAVTKRWCKKCNALCEEEITSMQWGRATDEGVRVFQRCFECKTLL